MSSCRAATHEVRQVLTLCLIRILSDWLEVKLGGDSASASREEAPEGTLQTLCVLNTVQKHGQRAHKVHITVKVRAVKHFIWNYVEHSSFVCLTRVTRGHHRSPEVTSSTMSL